MHFFKQEIQKERNITEKTSGAGVVLTGVVNDFMGGLVHKRNSLLTLINRPVNPDQDDAKRLEDNKDGLKWLDNVLNTKAAIINGQPVVGSVETGSMFKQKLVADKLAATQASNEASEQPEQPEQSNGTTNTFG